MTTTQDSSRHYGPVPFAQLRAELEALYAFPHRARKTGARMRQVLRELAALLSADATTEALTPELVTGFIMARPEGTATNNTLTLLRVVTLICNHAVRAGYLRVSPFALRKTWLRAEKPVYRQHLSREEVQRVLNTAEQAIARAARHGQAGPGAIWKARRTHAVIATVAYCGLRKMEALRLHTEDVDLERRWLHITARPGAPLKCASSERSVPIPAPLARILQDWIAHNDITSDFFFPNSSGDNAWISGGAGYKPLDRLRAVGKRAGLTDVTYMALRHSFATHALSAWGFTAEQLAKYMGHNSTKTQLYYIHEDTGNLRHKSALIRFTDGPDDPEDEADLPAAVVSWAPPRKGQDALVRPRPPRTNNPKLSDEQVQECRALRLRGWDYAALAAKYGLSKTCISYVLTNKTYRHVPFPQDATP